MADDPRIGEARSVLLRFHNSDARIDDAEHLVERLDAADPLRALLADEERAVGLLRARGLTGVQARRVLAALREVAGL